jgi:hypothetical protein
MKGSTMPDKDPTGHDATDSEPTGNVEPETIQPDDPAGDEEPNPQTAALEAAKAEAGKWKRYKRNQEGELKKLREQIKQLVDPAEVATVEQQLTDTTGSLHQAQTEAMKYRVALEIGLPMDLAVRLQGDSQEEMLQDAENLKKLMKPEQAGATKAAAASGPQKESAKPQDLNALMRQAVARS